MSALYILVIASISIAGSFLMAFIWSIRTDQYDDRDGSAMRMLQDNTIPGNQSLNIKDDK